MNTPDSADTPSPRSETADLTRKIFLGALECTNPAERIAYLNQACGTGTALRHQVDRMLDADARLGGFLESPALLRHSIEGSGSSEKEGTRVLERSVQPGERLGPYNLLQQIGVGGCGIVYMAEQTEPVRRLVAVKIIKLGMDTEQVIARFEAERQALAILDHPNIARVLDAGATSTGRPYFVMELVRGVRITEYCDQNRLPTEERLQLFMLVCQAIQHAHQKGIIHRDIKPSNILVTQHDGVPVPKVIDFGIAKATEQRLTEKTLFTEFQSFMGTPAYMSPEQAEMSGLDLDTRTDIYSLGVLLYELLTGRTPFDPDQLFEAGLDGCRQTIREQEPLKPSTRVATLDSEDRTSTAVRQRTEPLRLVHRLAGDLDWIVMKCLEKDRTRRYETANDIARDLQRYLDQEPILARPPSTWYRLQKFIRRNRILVGASVASSFILMVAVFVSTWMAVQATRAKEEQTVLRHAAEDAKLNERLQRAIAEKERVVALRRAYNSDMNLVQQALAANNHGRMLDLIERQLPKPGRPDFRLWEWYYFRDQTRSDAIQELGRLETHVQSLAAPLGGRILLVGDRRGQVGLWDWTRPARLASVLDGDTGWQMFGFSSDGQWALQAGYTFRNPIQMVLWNAANREEVLRFDFPGFLMAATIEPEDARILTLGDDREIRRWNIETGNQESAVSLQVEPEFTGFGPMGWSFGRNWSGMGSATFSPDARWLAVEDRTGVRIFDSRLGEERLRLAGETNGVATMRFSPDGDRLAVMPSFTSPEPELSLYDLTTGRRLFQLDAHAAWVPDAVFTPDGTRLISAGADQTIRVWDARNGIQLAMLHGHRSEVHALALTGDGTRLISGSRDGSILLWDISQLPARRTYTTLSERLGQVVFMPDGQEMLGVGLDGKVRRWSVNDWQNAEVIEAFGDQVVRLVVDSDGTRVYATTLRGEIVAIDWLTRFQVKRLSTESRGLLPLGVLHSGSTLVLAGGVSQRSVELWDTRSWERVHVWDMGREEDLLRGFRFGRGRSPGNPGNSGRDVRNDAAPPLANPGQVPGVRPPRGDPRGPGMNPGPRPPPPPRLGVGLEWLLGVDGKTLVVQDLDGELEERALETGETQSTLGGAGWGIWRLAQSVDGRWLASASNDGTIHLLDRRSGEWMEPMRGHLLGVHSLAFSPDGKRLASGSNGREAIKLWDLETQQEVATLTGEGPLFGSIEFSPDGEWLVSINGLGKVHLWHAPGISSREPISSGR